ncbi:hypothetical protein [Tabrizicola sp. M-4]|uniref:hypothetical protein n=1 Tax=Tabrizicola sp. M-4 TaxID=3055847 RepID=UPI003DA973B1
MNEDRTFSIFHLSLVEHRQPTLTSFRGSREQWLRLSLSERFEFSGWGGKELVWVPKGVTNELVFGLIQGKKPHSFHDSPNEGGAEKVDEFWQGAYLFLDPRHHDDGQKMAIENDVLGRPRALAKALFDHINGRDDASYSVIPELIFDETDFWKFAEESGKVLSFIRFEFAVPNMWDPQGDLEKDLRSTGRKTGTEQVDVTFRAKNGVTTDNDIIKSGVKYAGRGAGRIKARNRDGKRYSSETRATVESVPKADLDEASNDMIEQIAKKVLGRG